MSSSCSNTVFLPYLSESIRRRFSSGFSLCVHVVVGVLRKLTFCHSRCFLYGGIYPQILHWSIRRCSECNYIGAYDVLVRLCLHVYRKIGFECFCYQAVVSISRWESESLAQSKRIFYEHGNCVRSTSLWLWIGNYGTWGHSPLGISLTDDMRLHFGSLMEIPMLGKRRTVW